MWIMAKPIDMWAKFYPVELMNAVPHVRILSEY